jgi:4-hydroxy-tetrahydrodipicolinate reductase
METRILLIGAKGRMGQAIQSEASIQGCQIAATCDVGDDPAKVVADCDAIIDFSFHEATEGVAALAKLHGKPLVIGTTGHTAEVRTSIIASIEIAIPVVWAGNYSVGVNVLNFLTARAAAILQEGYDAEVLELHHNRKRDAPSGTAERLLEILRESRDLPSSAVRHGRSGIVGERTVEEIGVHAIRGGDIVGEHTVYFCGQGERIELTHRATDRRIFAQGALRAAVWASKAKAGVYNMEDVLGLR